MGTSARAGPYARAHLPRGPQARSQSLGGTVRQQHGQRQTTGSNCKYQEPTLPPSWDLEQIKMACGKNLLDPGEENKAQCPHICHLFPLGAVSPGVPQVVILTPQGAGKPQQAWTPQLVLPWQALQSPHDPLYFLPSISCGWVGGVSWFGVSPREGPECPTTLGPERGYHMMPLVRYWKPS